MHGTWSVEYTDGTWLSEIDSASPHYIPESREVPFRAIEWPRVRQLILESDLAKSRIDVAHNPAYVTSLRARTFMLETGEQLRSYIMLVSRLNEPIETSVEWALYWMPNGAVHECHDFDCQDVRRWAAQSMTSTPVGLPERHVQLSALAGAAIA